MKTWCPWFAVVLLLSTGCDFQRLATNQTADVLYEGSIVLEREPDVQLARDAMPASLKTMETFLVSAPDNEKLLELLAKGFYSYAFAFLEADLEVAQYSGATEAEIKELNRRCVLHYTRARDYGFMLLDVPEVKDAALSGDEKALAQALKNLDEDHVRGLFWVGYGWASAINLSQDDPDMVARLGVVEAIMRRVEQLDDNYFDSGVHYFFGVLYSSRPEMFGGDPEKAKQHFDIALERNGDKNLMIPFLYARFWATQTQNKDVFQNMMNRVLEADLNAHPDRRLNNAVAQKRARFWMNNMDELIFE